MHQNHVSYHIHIVSYSEPCQTSKMERFAKTVDGLKPLTIFTKHSILDVWQDSEYASDIQSYNFIYKIGFNYIKATRPLRKDSLSWSTASQGTSDTHFIEPKRMKGRVKHGSHLAEKCWVFILELYPLGHCTFIWYLRVPKTVPQSTLKDSCSENNPNILPQYNFTKRTLKLAFSWEIAVILKQVF